MHVSLILIASLFGSNDKDTASTWVALAKLLNQPKDSQAVTSFVDAHGLREATKGSSGSFTPDNHSYSILYRENRVDTIVLQVAPFPKGYGEVHWRPYSHNLPGRLLSRDGREEVVKKLGLPVKSRKNTWVHGGVHIWVHFNETDEFIDELYVSPRIIEASP